MAELQSIGAEAGIRKGAWDRFGVAAALIPLGALTLMVAPLLRLAPSRMIRQRPWIVRSLVRLGLRDDPYRS